MGEPPKPIRVTVLIDGIAEERTADGGQTIKQFISGLLAADQKTRADDYLLSTEDGCPLDPGSRLEDDNIPDGTVLALTKMSGGGGACRHGAGAQADQVVAPAKKDGGGGACGRP